MWMGGGPGFEVFGFWAAIVWLRVCLYLLDHPPALWAVEDGPVVAAVTPGVSPVALSGRDWGPACAADGHIT